MSATGDQLKKRLSAVIKGEEAAKFSSWQPPAMEGNLINKETIKPHEMSQSNPGQDGTVTAKSLEMLTEEAYQEGYQKGIKSGHQAGLEQQQLKVAQIDTLINAIKAKSEDFDEAITQQLVELVSTVAKHVIRKEISTSPDAILSLVQEVLTLIPINSEQMILKLNPADAEVIKSAYDIDNNPDIGWKLVEDPAIQQGGCILSSDTSVVNAELEQRIDTIVERLLGSNDDS